MQPTETLLGEAQEVTREEWLLRSIAAIRPIFEEAGIALPASIRVSTGWPGGKGAKARAIGQCWPTSTVSDGVTAIFISPVLTDRLEILATLVHELVHAADDCQSGHRGAFIQMARAVGLQQPWTATVATAPLAQRLTGHLDGLGDYDHGSIAVGSRKGTQTTRMLRVECSECGCVLRMTRKWIEDAGLPTCGCGGEMAEG